MPLSKSSSSRARFVIGSFIKQIVPKLLCRKYEWIASTETMLSQTIWVGILSSSYNTVLENLSFNSWVIELLPYGQCLKKLFRKYLSSLIMFDVSMRCRHIYLSMTRCLSADVFMT